jgi:hypothetical protein
MSYVPIRTFYSNLITNDHCTGDIWSDLPTFSLFKKSLLPGVIITPACDLANDKVETITYLPIIPIKHYLTTICFLSELKGIILSLSDQLPYLKCRKTVEETWPPCLLDVINMKNEISQIQCEGKKKSQKERLILLFEHIEKIVSDEWKAAEMSKLPMALGEGNFDRIVENITENNYRNDIYFVPADLQAPSWSVIEYHSVIMFRYPLTVPIDIFNLAQSKLIQNWQEEIDNLTRHFHSAQLFKEKQPMKMLQISQPFLHDMINRFVALYARLGSPDFTKHAVQQITKELKE